MCSCSDTNVWPKQTIIANLHKIAIQNGAAMIGIKVLSNLYKEVRQSENKARGSP